MFQKAVKYREKLRMALLGPAGSGKTYTALRVMSALVGPDGRFAAIDTENRSMRLYADEFDFDLVELETYNPETAVKLIREAEAAGYAGLIVDSMSHFWRGTEGMLDQVHRIAKAKYAGNEFAAWKDANPIERALWDTLLNVQLHCIITMRVKMDYVVEEVEVAGKKRSVPRKVGLQPIQRDGLEYEYHIVGDMDDCTLTITKTRCNLLTGKQFYKPGEDLVAILKPWLDGGADKSATTPEPVRPERQIDPVIGEIERLRVKLGLKNDELAVIWQRAREDAQTVLAVLKRRAGEISA